MEEEIEILLMALEEDMGKTVSFLDKALLKLRAGRANPAMLEGVNIEYYGSVVKLSQVANISTPDARTIFVQPFEKQMIEEVEKAILNANIGLNPQNNGEIVILNIPPLTEERRKELVRLAKSEGEEAKVGVRAVRKSGMDEVKKMEKNGLSEDNCKMLEADIQKIVESFNETIENKVLQKETDIMRV